MTIARYLSKFANLLNSDGKVVNAGIANNTLQSDKFASGTLGNFRNRIINGDMKISQRATSFANITNAYCIDRWAYNSSHAAVVTVTQNSDVPSGSGLSNSLRATVTTADTSIAVGDHSIINQVIEGYNVADLVGVPFTVSFWVRSSKTGVHCFRLRNSGGDRSYVSEYTINTANAWEKKSINISGGLITAGTWNFTNGIGLYATWTLAVGATYQTPSTNTWVSTNSLGTANQVNCLDTVGNIFAITGVQLERGSVASEFEFRPVQVELALCQRYYERLTSFIESTTPSGRAYNNWYYKVTKRVTASVINSGTGASGTLYNPTTYGVGLYGNDSVAIFGPTSSADAEL